MRHLLSLRADGVTRSNAPLAHTDGWRMMWMRNPMMMAYDVVRQPPKDGCIIVAPGWLAYLGLVVE